MALRSKDRAPGSGGQQLPELDRFFTLSLDLLCIASVEGCFQRVNPAFERVLGYSEHELTTRDYLEFVHPDDHPATRLIMAELEAGVPTVSFENRYLCRDGSYKWLRWTAAPEPETGLVYAVAHDMTGSKESEMELRQREQLLSQAESIVGAGSWEWDLRTDTISFSDELRRICNVSEWTSLTPFNLFLQAIAPADREYVERTLRSASRERQPFAFEYHVTGTDGELRTIRSRGRVLADASGRIARLLGTAQDVTDLQRADRQRNLLEVVTRAIHSADTVQSALQATLDHVCLADAWDYGEMWVPSADGAVLECSPVFYAGSFDLQTFRAQTEKRLATREATLPARVWSSMQAEWHADVTSTSEAVFCRAEEARSANLRTCVGLPLVADGVALAVLVLLRRQVSPEDPRGLELLSTAMAQLGSLVLRKRAEAALRQSEERFQIAACATNDVIYDLDLRTNALWLSDQLERNFGYPGGNVSLDWWAELIHPGDATAVDASLSAALRGADSFWSEEYRFRCADGSYSHVLDRGYILRDGNAEGVRMIGSMMDISERTRAAADLKQAKEAAEAAAQAKSAFLANMSHEIRTPLTAVLGFADLLLDPKLDDSERLNYAMTIRRNGEHLLALLSDILDLSKIEAGKMSVEEIEFSPARILTEVASLMRVRAIEKNLEFGLRYDSPMPLVVRSDPTRLRQIVLNLVNNAIKFTERGSVHIVARCDMNATSCTLHIEVVDTGIGIAPEQTALLFQPFSQADASMTRRYGGTGLGLGICAPLAVALGGSIAVQSEVGQGSTFRLSIPVRAANGSELTFATVEAFSPGAPEPLLVAGPISARTALQGTVLLAEDGPDNQLLIASVLRKRGLDVTVVDNGRRAVERALGALESGCPYDLVLMDMHMPELDGYGATAQLRAKGYEGVIVALTAHAMAGERERCIAAGCDDYLTKPIEREKLLEALSSRLSEMRHSVPPLAPASPPRPSTSLPPLPRALRRPAVLISTYADDLEMAAPVGAFVQGLPSQVTVMRDAARRDDRPKLRRLAHQLKGAAGGYGFPSITEAAARLEASVQDEVGREALEQALSGLLSLCERAQPAARGSTPSAVVRSKAPCVLIIDDSPDIHQLIEARLRSESLITHRAMDAASGLALATALRPDLILLDLDLAGVDGLEVCKQLKASPNTATIPVVFLTGTADSATKAAAFDLGAVDYVTKPFDGLELRARVRAALRTKRYQDLLTTRAQVDGLTGLCNRAYFDTRLHEEHASALRNRRALALALLDIDHFKHINDTYGHPFGDHALQEVANGLWAIARAEDAVCRYGGEEFAIILPGLEGSAAVAAAERLRTAITELTLQANGGRVPVTASVGVAWLSSNEPKQRSANRLLDATDQALYRAKRTGRNRVESTAPA
ncbi:MAG TPA: response regulator [Polyangiaceae bacterium]|nr:response regulator [Polyangiaceae bacterium]